MTLTASTPTEPGDAGLLIPHFYEFMAQNPVRLARVLGRPSIKNTATTDAAESGQVIDLTDAGFTFLANTLYQVRLKYWAQTDNDRWYFEREYTVLGGTTPVILDTAPEIEKAVGVIAGTAVKYGRVAASATYAQDTATAVAANSTLGCSLGNISSGVAVFTHPIKRATPVRYWVNIAADVAANDEPRAGGIFATNATTAAVNMSDLATPTEDGFADVGAITAFAYIEPPPNAFLTMNSNNVEVHVSHDASDEVLHTVEVFIDEGHAVPFHGGA
jgi:hypothetical protein